MAFRRSRSIYLACTAVSALLLSSQAFAQEQPDAVQLDRLVINPNVKKKKPAAAASDTPLATQTTGEEIAKNEIKDIKDLGNTTEPGVDYSKRTDGASIRGLSGPRVATLVDGIPIPYLENYARGSTSTITNSDGGGSSFDFSSLSALDILRGSDSSRVGSGALAGALVMRTLEPEDLIQEGRNWGGLAKASYDSADRGITGSMAVAARFGGTSALLQGSYKRGDETETNGTVGGYGRARTEANPADLDQNNVLFKLRHEFGGGHRIGITAERFDRQKDTGLATDWTVGAAGAQYPVGNYWSQDDTRRERVSLDYRYEAPSLGGIVNSAFATAYWQRLTKHAGAEGLRANNVYYLRDNMLEESAFGLTGGANGEFSTGGLEHDWTTGFSLQRLSATSFIEALPVTSTGDQADIPDVDGTRFGIFVDDRIALGDGRFALTPGLRFDWHQYTPKESDAYATNSGIGIFGLPPANSDSQFSPKLLATYDVNPELQFFAQWAMSYRAPTMSELYLNFTNPGLYAVTGNSDLKSETGQGIELGATLGNESFGGRVTVFHNRYRNFIAETALAPDPNYPGLAFGVQSFENISKVEISGIELKAHKVFENGISLSGGLSYVYGKDMDANTFLRSVAPFKGIAGIGYERETWGVNLTGIFVGKMRDDHVATTFDAPSYAIANLTGWWEPEFAKGMRIQAGVYNLTDETYYDALATRTLNPSTFGTTNQAKEFYSEPGRTFKLSLTQRF